MIFYTDLSRAFHWTPEQIDSVELEMLFDYVIVLTRDKEEEGQYIDEVWM